MIELEIAGCRAEIERGNIRNIGVARSAVDFQRQIRRHAHLEIDIGVVVAEAPHVVFVRFRLFDHDLVARTGLDHVQIGKPVLFGRAGPATHFDARQPGHTLHM